MAGATDFEPRATKSKSLHHSLKRGFALHKLDMQVNEGVVYFVERNTNFDLKTVS